MSTEIMFDNGNKLELRNGTSTPVSIADSFKSKPIPPKADGTIDLVLPSGSWPMNAPKWTSDTFQVGEVKPDVRMYSHYESPSNNRVICRIDKDGRVHRDGIDITDNDAALAQCFIEQLKTFHNIEVNRGS